MRLAGAVRSEDRRVRTSVLAKQLIGDVDRILLLGVTSNVFENVHRLERLGERAAPFAKDRVALCANARRVLVPEIGKQIADCSRHVVAVLLVFLETLNPDAARILENELSHSGDHLANPALSDV